jgi:hypothetical protein
MQTSGGCLHWVGGGTALRSFLGAPPNPPLLNGTVTWDQNAIDAANDWNGVGAAFRFNTEVGGEPFDPCACPNPGGNPALFSDTACGGGFGDIVAQTNGCFNPETGELVAASVFVNQNVHWNAYDGPLRRPLNDIRRVLLHEFGHVVGLDHPDKHGQTVVAIMNSRESDLDRLQADDVAGIAAIYPNTVPASNNECQVARPGRHSGWILLFPAVIAAGRWRRQGKRPRRRDCT